MELNSNHPNNEQRLYFNQHCTHWRRQESLLILYSYCCKMYYNDFRWLQVMTNDSSYSRHSIRLLHILEKTMNSIWIRMKHEKAPNLSVHFDLKLIISINNMAIRISSPRVAMWWLNWNYKRCIESMLRIT